MPFQRLSTRLTVLYAGLFGAVLLLVSAGVFIAINQAAQRQVRTELNASGAVFQRLWSLRLEGLREGAELLSRDLGFREAVATQNDAAIVSSLDAVRRKLSIDHAFLVRPDGRVVGLKLGAEARGELDRAFARGEAPSGLLMIDDQHYQVVSAPVYAPERAGWIAFAVRLDREELGALEQLSAIPLDALVLHREAHQRWHTESTAWRHDEPELRAFIDRTLVAGNAGAQALTLNDGRAMAMVKPLPTLDGDGAAVLLLLYPLSRALAPYQPLLLLVALVALAGLAVVSWGSWMIARGVTRPISELDDAVQRLQRGQDAQVAVAAADEVGRLAESFNAMATVIRDRERRITHLALHDEETGLPNRLSLERVVDGLRDRPHGQVYVAALGIRRFDHLRGAIGHALSAQAVKIIGARLATLAPASGVARIATDALGFTLVAQGAAAALDDARRLIAELEQPLSMGRSGAIDVAFDLGLAPLDGALGAASAIEFAGVALDQARTGRRKVTFFDAEAYGEPAANLSLMSSLLKAIDTGALELHYQPKFDMRRREINGVEALARWRHPVRGLLPPDLFIPMAEETGHIRAMTEWVMKRAIADQKTLAREGFILDMSVNISGRTLGEDDFAEFALAEVRGAAGKLMFEVTETAIIDDPDQAFAMLDRFAAAGVGISIDDFGAGFSSLTYLKRIRGQELKIDKSLVEGVAESQRDAMIVRSTIDLAHSLGLKVTAEGVETEEGFALLAAMGCDQAQGFLIARPMPLRDLLRFLSRSPAEEQKYG